MDRLQDDGILSVTRYFPTPTATGPVAPLATYRTIALASEVLTERGVANPRNHIMVYRDPTVYPGVDLSTVLVNPDPFTQREFATVAGRGGTRFRAGAEPPRRR